MPNSTSGRQAVRLDTDHTVQHLMATAIARISGSIRIEIQEREVCLTGTAQSWHAKQLAQETLRTVSDSYVIRNEIRVAAWG